MCGVGVWMDGWMMCLLHVFSYMRIAAGVVYLVQCHGGRVELELELSRCFSFFRRFIGISNSPHKSHHTPFFAPLLIQLKNIY